MKNLATLLILAQNIQSQMVNYTDNNEPNDQCDELVNGLTELVESERKFQEASDNMIWFGRNHSGYNATPLKMKVGKFEISVAGDDSAGALPEFSRTELCIFKEGVAVKTIYPVNFKHLIEAVQYCIDNQ